MYLHLGGDVTVSFDSVVGIFDLDNTTSSKITRRFLQQAEKKGRVINVNDDLPKSFIVAKEYDGVKIYISQISPKTLLKRAETGVGDAFS